MASGWETEDDGSVRLRSFNPWNQVSSWTWSWVHTFLLLLVEDSHSDKWHFICQELFALWFTRFKMAEERAVIPIGIAGESGIPCVLILLTNVKSICPMNSVLRRAKLQCEWKRLLEPSQTKTARCDETQVNLALSCLDFPIQNKPALKPSHREQYRWPGTRSLLIT